MKPTPGPWKVDEYDCSVHGSNGLTVVEMPTWRISDHAEELKANAKLIAAAPKMKEALEAAERVLSDLPSTSQDGTRTREVFLSIRSILKEL